MDPMVIKCGWTIPERNRGFVRKIIELNGGFCSHVCQRVWDIWDTWDRDGIDVRYAMPSATLMVDHVGYYQYWWHNRHVKWTRMWKSANGKPKISQTSPRLQLVYVWSNSSDLRVPLRFQVTIGTSAQTAVLCAPDEFGQNQSKVSFCFSSTNTQKCD
jgi:hypothetical protein